MRRCIPALLALSAATLVVVPAGGAVAAPSSTVRNAHACPAPQNGSSAECYAVVHEHVDSSGKIVPNASGGPSGYGPSNLQSAYALSTSASGGAGRTVAIVDAYDDPNAAGDLAQYRLQYGLPAVSTCTVTSTSVSSPSGPCFVKVNQSGATSSYPIANGGWAQEISLDLDMVSAICPNCNVVLVEASSSSFTNLGNAVNTAARLGVAAISNSYGSSGDASDSTYGGYYNHPGIAVTASTGDNGYGVGYPATSAYTVAVGGTSLSSAPGTARGWTETAWSGAGSGCSTYQSEPSFQTSAGITACSGRRGIADVSAVADPNTGVAVYDSYAYQGASGWLVFGGTSVASPVIASMYALAGASGPGSTTSYPAALAYGATASLNDVTSGSTGSCSPAMLCNAGTGWDGPTGLGTPKGLGAFGGTSSGGGGGGNTAPAAPSGLTANAGNASVTLNWTQSTTSGVTYSVYRSTSSPATTGSTKVATGLTSTTWQDTGVTNGTTYYYVVTAQATLESAASNQASATPSATSNVIHVGSITYNLTGNRRTLNITVTVLNSANQPVTNASVTITVSLNGASIGSANNTTSSTGAARFSVSRPSSGTYKTTVNSVTDSGFVWDGVTPANSTQV